MKICPNCNGKGRFQIYDCWGKIEYVYCNWCDGKGVISDDFNPEYKKWKDEQIAEENERKRYWNCYSEGVSNAQNNW